jgi:hypothetical protein
MTDQLSVPLRYWSRGRNIGDSINPYIVELVSGCIPSFCYSERAEHVLGIGSVFFMATRTSHIWGAGILDPRRPLDNVDPSKIHAVRGSKTLELLRSRLSFKKDVPIGDPGIFVDELTWSPPDGGKRYKHCVVPHHAFVKHPYFLELAEGEAGILLDPRTDRLDFVETMSRAEMVFSQSLHGLVFATALNIPCVWISHSTDEIWTFKFWDWFSNTIDPPPAPIPLGVPLKALFVIARKFHLRSDRNALRNAFPAAVRQSIAPRIGFRDSRLCEPYVVLVSCNSRQRVTLDYYSRIDMSAANDLELQTKLNRLSASFHDLPNVVLVFDEAVYKEMTIAELNALRRLLEERPELHFISFQDANERNEGSGASDPPFVLGDFHQNLQWKGVLFLRHGINFSYSAPGLAAFRPA